MSSAAQVLITAGEQLPEDVGKSGPFGLLLVVLLLIAAALLVKSMSGHLNKLPHSFDPADREPVVEVPDDISELDDPAQPGQELLDTLRRAPLAIEAPRRDEDGTATER
ncbi:hypothetical protein [Blastococcus sp. LR1]|uniref:hypothetical protein n=1 Tax=Blastococcus sp. LR1 TaxID=2877000 RepID=UPI001CC950A0|nr:hypothetical protein [Blastococcus sp. LR1]MCA0144523.1 hypothetical protein [Blastococcus sp. LR1]